MEMILIPGLWLAGSTWDAVVPLLQEAGHRPRALTLPGMESKAADRSGITLADHVDAVVAAVDGSTGPVLLVGHSAGAALAQCAIDARPGQVSTVVYVGGFPIATGEPLADGLPSHHGEVAMPDWRAAGEPAMVADFTEEELASFYRSAIPSPAQVVSGRVALSNDQRRYEVPVTAVCTEYTSDTLRHWIAAGNIPELRQARSLKLVDLPGGHWPQLTQPKPLAHIILDAAGSVSP